MFKANNIKNFDGIGKVAWELISSIYNSGWDLLIADNHNNSFKQKVAFKFTSIVNLEKNSKKGEKDADKPARIKRISPLIPAKLLKEVKEISKYFKPMKPATNIKTKFTLYVQASKPIGNTEEVLKIKEAFLLLKAKSIDNI